MDTVRRPYAINAPHYMCDSTDFPRNIQSLINVPENTIVATLMPPPAPMDVESLYTNIPHKDGLQA